MNSRQVIADNLKGEWVGSARCRVKHPVEAYTSSISIPMGIRCRIALWNAGPGDTDYLGKIVVEDAAGCIDH